MAGSLRKRLDKIGEDSKKTVAKANDRMKVTREIENTGYQSENKEVNEILSFIQTRILADYPSILAKARSNDDNRSRLRAIVSQLLVKENIRVENMEREKLSDYLVDEIIGYGPIEVFIRDSQVSEIMVNGSRQVFVEKDGKIQSTEIFFKDDDHVLAIIERIVAPIGRRIDQSSPYVDARLPDGSRVHAIIPPLSLTGPILTIRKFLKKSIQMDGLVKLGSLSLEMASFLNQCVQAKMNVMISGGTGSGKTTLLNALSGNIPDSQERIITIEDAAELKLNQNHVISLECRPPNIEGKGEITIRQLLRNALRMRPDRIIIGECRGAEAFDMLQAMNTGHSGSLTTIHANHAKDALSRLENMILMAGENLPYNIIREQIVSAIDIIVQQARFADGSRKVTSIAKVNKVLSGNSQIELKYVYQFEVEGLDQQGRLNGDYVHNEDIEYSDDFITKIKAAGLESMQIENKEMNT